MHLVENNMKGIVYACFGYVEIVTTIAYHLYSSSQCMTLDCGQPLV